MNSSTRAFVLTCSLLAFAGAHAQTLPDEISGRWHLGSGRSQTFALEGIKPGPGDDFQATLTWWTLDPNCAIRGKAVSGKVTAQGLRLDATTQCKTSFTIELERRGDAWGGQARAHGSDIAAEQRAK